MPRRAGRGEREKIMFEMKPCKDEPGFENSENFQHYFQYAESGVDLMLVQCGYEHCEANHYWAGSAEFHRFHVVISGCGTLEIGDKVHHIRAGDAFFIPMDMKVRYRADGVNPWEYRWVSVVGTKMSFILTKMEISRRFCVTLKQADILIDRAKKIYDCACEGSAQGDLMALGHVYFFLAELMEQCGSQVSVEDTSVNYVHRATDYIREHYAGDTSVDSICQWLNISRSYLYKLFRRYYGISPSSYLIHYRLEKARELLNAQQYAVNEVAEMVGFSDHPYFTKCFRMAYGMPPREYARRLHKEKKKK